MTTKVNAKQVAIALILGVGVYALLTTDFKKKKVSGELKSSADGDYDNADGDYDSAEGEDYANAEGDEDSSADGMDPMYDFDGDYSYGEADADLLEADVTGKDEIMSYADATAAVAAVGKPAAAAAVKVKESKEQKAAKEKAKQLAHWQRRVTILSDKIRKGNALLAGIAKRQPVIDKQKTDTNGRIPIWTKKLEESKLKVAELSK